MNELDMKWGEALVNTALKWEGSRSVKYTVPELGISPVGFDCSGYAWFVLNQQYSQIGSSEPSKIRQANEFHERFGKFLNPADRLPGDLVFELLSSPDEGYLAKHMGFLVTPDEYIQSEGIDGGKVRRKKLSDIDLEIQFKRTGVNIGRYCFSNATLREFQEYLSVAGQNEIDINDPAHLEKIFESLNPDNSLRKNILQLQRLAISRGADKLSRYRYF